MTSAEFVKYVTTAETRIKELLDVSRWVNYSDSQKNDALQQTRIYINTIAIKAKQWMKDPSVKNVFDKFFKEAVDQLKQAGEKTSHLKANPKKQNILSKGIDFIQSVLTKTINQRVTILDGIKRVMDTKDIKEFNIRQTLLDVPIPSYAKDELKKNKLATKDNYTQTKNQLTKILDRHIQQGMSPQSTAKQLRTVLDKRYPAGDVYFPVYKKDGTNYIKRLPVSSYVDGWITYTESAAHSSAVVEAANMAGHDLVKVKGPTNTDEACLHYVNNVYSLSGKSKKYPKLDEYPPFHHNPYCKHYLTIYDGD